MTTPVDRCQCTGLEDLSDNHTFWCDAHQCRKTQHWLKLCRTKEHYREAWNEGRGPGQQRGVRHRGKVTEGPGTELKKLLAVFGIRPEGTCACRARAERMNEWGPDGCQQRKETILGWLREEAFIRKMFYLEFAAARLLQLAIWKARRRQKSQRPHIPTSAPTNPHMHKSRRKQKESSATSSHLT